MIKSDANMSDTRRRRHKSDQSHASDDLSDSFDELVGTKETLVKKYSLLLRQLNSYFIYYLHFF